MMCLAVLQISISYMKPLLPIQQSMSSPQCMAVRHTCSSSGLMLAAGRAQVGLDIMDGPDKAIVQAHMVDALQNRSLTLSTTS